MPLRPNALVSTLSRHFDLSKSRLETLATLIIGCVCARTVNLSHIAGHFDGEAQTASNYRRLQRFFQSVQFDEDWLARAILVLLNLRAPYTLCLDRTNWKIGCRHINLLVVCVAARRVRVPLMWTVLDKAGNSTLSQRKRLMRRVLTCLGSDAIHAVLGDREFIGQAWFEFLLQNQLPFVIRVKQGLVVRLKNGRVVSLASLFTKHRGKTTFKAHRGWFKGMDQTGSDGLCFAAKRLKDNTLLIVATTLEPKQGLNLYKRRWQIECLFADTKTRGLNLEDTRMTAPHKLSLLIGVVALALVWSHLAASKLKGRQNIKRASHGYRRKSWFRTGFDCLRRWLFVDPTKAHILWSEKWPKRKTTLPLQ